MTDRELLERAAKASGEASGLTEGVWVDAGLNLGTDAEPIIWNPLTDDGDALRLMTRLRIDVAFVDQQVIANMAVQGTMGDTNAHTRRAIVRAAAGIGEPQ